MTGLRKKPQMPPLSPDETKMQKEAQELIRYYNAKLGIPDYMEDLYQHFKKYDYWQLQDLFDKAKTKEEQDFYACVSDFVLQKRKAKVILGENPNE